MRCGRNEFQRGWSIGVVCGVPLTTLVGACSLLTDSSTSQCTTTTNCTDVFGPNAPYVCDVESAYCVRPPCEVDGDCRARGGNFSTSICGADKLCTEAECTINDHCGDFAVCNTATNRCAQRQCQVLADCQLANPSPTVQCVGGVCVDEVWGCLGEGDDRTSTLPTATVKISLLELFSHAPLGGTVTPCLLPQFDPAPNPGCTPVLGAVTTFENGMVTISNLAQGQPIRIHYEPVPAPYESLIMPTDIYSQKVPRDVTEYPAALIPYVAVVQALSGAFDPPVPIPLDSAGATLDFFDCRGMKAKDVFLRPFAESDRLPDTRITYFGEGGLPDPTATETDESGHASIINMKKDITVTLKVDIRGTPSGSTPRTLVMTEYPMMLFGSRMGTIEIHARKYRQ